MKLKNSHYYFPYRDLERQGQSFADFSKGKNYYNQLAFLFELTSSRSPHTKNEVEFLIKVAKKYIKEKLVFIDAACGSGRHSNILSKKGFKNYAFDASKKLLTIAKQRDRKTIYKHADFRNFHFKHKANCVFSFWEAYNYLSQQHDIEVFLLNCYKSLDKGGILVLDSRNFWKKQNRQEKVQHRKYQTAEYDIDLLIKKKTVLKDKIHEGLFEYNLTNKKTKIQNTIIDQELVRIWSPRELVTFSNGKFKLKEVFGDFDIRYKYKKLLSNRMIIVLERN